MSDLIDLAEGYVRGLLEHGEIGPAILVEIPDQGHAVIPLNWANEHEKAATRKALRLTLKKFRASAYAIWCECWMSTALPGQDKPDVMPSADPNHIDGLVIVCVKRGQAPVVRSWQVVEGQGKRTLKPLGDEMADATGSGWLGELFS